MPYGDHCSKACRKEHKCKAQKAFAQIKLVFHDPNLPSTASTNPFAEVSEYAPHCGVKHAELVKIYGARTGTAVLTASEQLFPGECAAFKIKVAYDDCYFACGFVPNLQVTACAPDEHHYNALVRPLCGISNNQHAFFRVDIYPNATCYPECAETVATMPQGVVAFNIVATQGNECKY